ncbi:hypothetical protein [Protofrankia symbiont of Coriaria ruscifolia]|uniref:hypothetical protein n=1 Tax=Protofrankia symbiont of Coriaria ruscifolia TaxID=1306542 RepID=UPI001A93B2D6|nr:hypothetical protein [Protofrankia symbiont of Coriaria ruscifolia]
MWTCVACGSSQRPGIRFCTACGTASPSTAQTPPVRPDPRYDETGKTAPAGTIDSLLTGSGATRGAVGAAVERVAHCTDLSGAEADLLSAATGRDALANELDGLTVNAIPGGRDIAADLRSAWLESAAADRAYGAWAHEVTGVCVSTAPATPSSVLAQQRVPVRNVSAGANAGDLVLCLLVGVGCWRPASRAMMFGRGPNAGSR